MAVSEFINAKCYLDPNASIITSLLFDKYILWCVESQKPAQCDLKAFVVELTRLGYRKGRTEFYRLVYGIGYPDIDMTAIRNEKRGRRNETLRNKRLLIKQQITVNITNNIVHQVNDNTPPSPVITIRQSESQDSVNVEEHISLQQTEITTKSDVLSETGNTNDIDAISQNTKAEDTSPESEVITLVVRRPKESPIVPQSEPTQIPKSNIILPNTAPPNIIHPNIIPPNTTPPNTVSLNKSTSQTISNSLIINSGLPFDIKGKDTPESNSESIQPTEIPLANVPLVTKLRVPNLKGGKRIPIISPLNTSSQLKETSQSKPSSDDTLKTNQVSKVQMKIIEDPQEIRMREEEFNNRVNNFLSHLAEATDKQNREAFNNCVNKIIQDQTKNVKLTDDHAVSLKDWEKFAALSTFIITPDIHQDYIDEYQSYVETYKELQAQLKIKLDKLHLEEPGHPLPLNPERRENITNTKSVTGDKEVKLSDQEIWANKVYPLRTQLFDIEFAFCLLREPPPIEMNNTLLQEWCNREYIACILHISSVCDEGLRKYFNNNNYTKEKCHTGELVSLDKECLHKRIKWSVITLRYPNLAALIRDAHDPKTKSNNTPNQQSSTPNQSPTPIPNHQVN